MKIVVSRISDGTFGGAELSAIDHAKSYLVLGHEVTMITNIEQPRLKGLKTYRTLWPHRHGGLLKLITFPLFSIHHALVTLWVKIVFRPDIYNPHSRDDQVIQTLLRPIHRTPVVWKDPADLRHFLARERSGFFWRLNNTLLHNAVQRADAIYTLNPNERDLIFKEIDRLGLNRPRIELIPSSILYSDYNLKAEAPQKKNSLVISTIIRLIDHKGVQYLIEAFKTLKDSSNIELWIVGDGPYRDELEELAGSDERIEFFGFRSDVSTFYAAIDIFVQPAEFEGWGRNVKEAMYFGLPVVGSNVGGIAKQITDEENGLLFPVGDIDKLSKQLNRLIEDKALRKKLGTAAKKKALADGDYVNLINEKVIPLFREFTDA